VREIGLVKVCPGSWSELTELGCYQGCRVSFSILLDMRRRWAHILFSSPREEGLPGIRERTIEAEAAVCEIVQLLVELARVGPWAVGASVAVWLGRGKELMPLRKWLWASLFDRLLRRRGVDRKHRHAILVAAALKAQDLTATELSLLPEPSGDSPMDGEAPMLKAVPPT
jgi:hypothetical protein